MRKTLGVCLLVLLLTGTTSAGEIPNMTPAPPPSQQTSNAQEPTDTNQDPATGGVIPNDVTESLTQAALDLLALLPTLL